MHETPSKYYWRAIANIRNKKSKKVRTKKNCSGFFTESSRVFYEFIKNYAE